MSKWCFNFESGEYEYIDKNGFSESRSEYVHNWDDSEYRKEEEERQKREQNRIFQDDEDN